MAISDFTNPSKFPIVMDIINKFKEKNKAYIDKGQPAPLQEMLNLGIDLAPYSGEVKQFGTNALVYWNYHNLLLTIKLIWPNFKHKARHFTIEGARGVGIYIDYTFDGKNWVEGHQLGTPMEGKMNDTPTETTLRDLVDADGRTLAKEIAMSTGLGYNYWTDSATVLSQLNGTLPPRQVQQPTQTIVGANGAMVKETKATTKPRAKKATQPEVNFTPNDAIAPAPVPQPVLPNQEPQPQFVQVPPVESEPQLPVAHTIGNNNPLPSQQQLEKQFNSVPQPQQPVVPPQPAQFNTQPNQDTTLFFSKLLELIQQNQQFASVATSYIQSSGATSIQSVSIEKWKELLATCGISIG